MENVEKAFASLVKEVKELESRYIGGYLPANPEVKPEDFEHDVKAFCVLAHAALEEFVEALSDALMVKLINQFLEKKITLSTASFLLAYGRGISVEDDEAESQASCFNQIRLTLDEGKKQHSKILMDNHGFSVRYLRSILTPVGLNVPSTPLLDSVKKLADARGTFAHSRAKLALYGGYRAAKTPMVPEEAQTIVNDCLDLCDGLKKQAESL